jgi:hypothetical protein
LNLITCHLNKFIAVVLSIVSCVAASSSGSCVDSGIVCEVLGARTECVSYVKFLGEACGLLLGCAVAVPPLPRLHSKSCCVETLTDKAALG